MDKQIVSGAGGRYREVAQLIAGQEMRGRGAKTMQVIDPATETSIAEFSCAGPEDLDAALASVARGFRLWRAKSPYSRCAIMHRAATLIRQRAEVIAFGLSLEQGKPIGEARGEIEAAIDVFDWYAEEGRRCYGRTIAGRAAGTRFTVVREPVGPVAAFTPWNFPALTPARKIAAALGAGCSIVIKPSEESPATCLELAECCLEAGVPADVIAVVVGDAQQIATHLIRSPVIRKVSFTGSIAGGRAIAGLAAEGIKRVTMELGGHAPVLVFDDCDIMAVAELAARRKFKNAGQICVSPSRFYIQRSAYERFAEQFVRVARGLRMGHGHETGTDVGPLANRRRVEACEALVGDALSKGAELLAGGSRSSNSGYYFPPTVLGRTPVEARIMHDEPFGPIAPLTVFDSEEDAIAQANSLPVGLAAFAFTGSASRVIRLGDQLECGMVGINRFEISVAETPFGGIKESGYGSEGGTEGLDAYLATKLISQA